MLCSQKRTLKVARATIFSVIDVILPAPWLINLFYDKFPCTISKLSLSRINNTPSKKYFDKQTVQTRGAVHSKALRRYHQSPLVALPSLTTMVSGNAAATAPTCNDAAAIALTYSYVTTPITLTPPYVLLRLTPTPT